MSANRVLCLTLKYNYYETRNQKFITRGTNGWRRFILIDGIHYSIYREPTEKIAGSVLVSMVEQKAVTQKQLEVTAYFIFDNHNG